MVDNKDLKENEHEEQGIAMEIFAVLKRVIIFQWIAIGALILIMAAQSFYHDYKWSEFDTVVLDSGDGGNANYIGNDGDINNYGESSSSQETESRQ